MGKSWGPGKPSQRDYCLKSLTLHAFGQREKMWQETGRKMEGRTSLQLTVKWGLSCSLLDHAGYLPSLWDLPCYNWGCRCSLKGVF